ncbi:MAG: tetratricopeptide repeat protein [Myxococcota bacterium]
MRSLLLRTLITTLVALSTTGTSCRHATGPTNTDERDRHMAACRDYLEKRDLDAAYTRCRLCLEYDRANPECTNLMGVQYNLRGNFMEARDWYKRAIRYRNDFAEARNNLGALLMEQDQRYDEAIQLFRSALDINPGYVDARLNLATAHVRQGDVEMVAGQQWMDAHHANWADPQVLRSTFADAEERYALADDQLRRLLEIDPRQPRAWSLLGYVELTRARYAPTENARRAHLARAEERLTRCVELAPPDSREARQCHGNLGAALENQSRCDGAMAHYMACLSTAPRDPECLAGVQRTYSCHALMAGALRASLDHVRNNPTDAQAHLAVCAGAFQAGLVELGAGACENALLLDSRLCTAHVWLVQHYRNVLNAERTVGHCRALLACEAADGAAAAECREVITALGGDISSE